MTPDSAPGLGKDRPRARRGRHRAQRRRSAYRAVGAAKVLASLVSVSIVVLSAIGWYGHHTLSSGITTSQALADEPASVGPDQNILIMGLDSRRDQQGRQLPTDIYDALHAGDESSGEDDSDVLIVLHVPGGGGPVTAISIPRDDYVDLSGCPMPGECRGKVKHAYNVAYEHVMQGTAGGKSRGTANKADARDVAIREQKAREAGRKAEISTVRRLLQIPIDHFIEVSLVAFFQIARVVQPITVCLDHNTADPSYSGAKFQKGTQQIDAAQALAFVRQRRDVNDESFTDLDRTRRQQAFIASLVISLRHSAALTNPGGLHQLLDVVKQNVAVDARFDIVGFVRQATAFGDRALTLYTLPVIEFTEISDGEDVNIIDVPTVRSIVHQLLSDDSAGTAPNSGTGPASGGTTTTQPDAPGIVLNVVNAAGREGLATSLEKAFAAKGLNQGATSTAATTSASTVKYGPGAQAAANAVADELGLTATSSNTVAPNTVQLTAGTDIRADDYLDSDSQASQPPTTVPATPVATAASSATGTAAPAPTDLTRMNATKVPCVK